LIGHNPPQKQLRPLTGFHLPNGTTNLAPTGLHAGGVGLQISPGAHSLEVLGHPGGAKAKARGKALPAAGKGQLVYDSSSILRKPLRGQRRNAGPQVTLVLLDVSVEFHQVRRLEAARCWELGTSPHSGRGTWGTLAEWGLVGTGLCGRRA
jgi:hypothetical protein